MAIDKAVDSAVLDAKFTAIADAIRGKTGGTETMTEDEMPEQVNAVFEAGEKSERDRFWDMVQANGTRANYAYAFYYWDAEYIRPKYKSLPIMAFNSAFFGNPNLKKIEGAYFDLSQLSDAATVNYSFSTCAQLEHVEDIQLPAMNSYYHTWGSCPSLRSIDVVRVKKETTFTNAFYYCTALENLTIEGVIGQNGFDVSRSVLLTHDSLMSIIDALADYSADTSGTVWTVTLGETNLAKLSEEEIGIAESKGWVLA